MTGSELSHRFFNERLLPLVRQTYPSVEPDMAASVLGMGSDASGLDDELSREHHWGPRCNILPSEHLQGLCAEMERFLQQQAGSDFLWSRFNDVEKWQEVVKEVILDPDWKAGFPNLET